MIELVAHLQTSNTFMSLQRSRSNAIAFFFCVKSKKFDIAVDQVIKDACAVGLLHEGDEIVSLHLTEMAHGYPLPTLSSEEKVN